MLTPFTTVDDVRALLGVSSEELPDRTLNLPVYEIALRRKVRSLDEARGIVALFVSLDVNPSRNALENAAHQAIYYYASLVAATQAGLSLALVAPKRITDDKSGVERFSDSPYRDVLARLEAELAAARAAAQAALADLFGLTPPAQKQSRQFVAVKRSYDPVTGGAG